MITLPTDNALRRSLVAGLFLVALGFFFFEGYGAFLGRFEDDIIQWQAQQVEARPNVTQIVEGQPATPEQAAAKAWERIKFFHGHGYLMVLATFTFLLLIANAATLGVGVRAILIWLSVIAMVLYNVGWGLAGWLVPFLGAKPAKELGEYFFFIPFGLTIVVITGIIAYAWGRQLFGRPTATT